MELSKIKPSKIYDNSQMSFNSILEHVFNSQFDGFIRITTKSTNEGYILFKKGKEIAASFSSYLKNFVLDEEFKKEEALKKIEYESHKPFKIEIFELTHHQIDFSMEINKKYLLEEACLSKKYYNNNSPNNAKQIAKVSTEPSKISDNNKNLNQVTTIIDTNEKDLNTIEEYYENSKLNINSEDSVQYDVLNEYPNKLAVNQENLDENLYEDNQSHLNSFDEIKIPNSFTNLFSNIDNNRSPDQQTKNITTLINAVKKGKKSKLDVKKDPNNPSNGKRSINELKILLKTLHNDKIEMLELNIINNIKKRLLNLPRIKEKSVKISITRQDDIIGNANIVTEYTGKAFFDSYPNSSTYDVSFLEKEIFHIVQIEIKSAFGNFHDVLDYFAISVQMT
ncbi:MAG TPA: hypothetical protein GX531_05640 [Methanothermobacter sp.]|nr:hypothetical protein [Methanothermobacter sp.]